VRVIGTDFPDELVCYLLLFVGVIGFFVVVVVLFQLIVSGQLIGNYLLMVMFDVFADVFSVRHGCLTLLDLLLERGASWVFIFAIGAYYYNTLIRRRDDVA
jgi:hypothetical protein